MKWKDETHSCGFRLFLEDFLHLHGQVFDQLHPVYFLHSDCFYKLFMFLKGHKDAAECFIQSDSTFKTTIFFPFCVSVSVSLCGLREASLSKQNLSHEY